ncbi:alpha/beta fold hydrolase [Oleomonas cavernae]|uniref:Alpha/beta fold hydrolase n=1 Tax=Oleomonas cavernae TaxID=2320859 RepID=A0A418WGB2_9PROT|nr:haloalkane dehalogenase [Oleomonas cavernae]RJF89030.1 alpha/beta fold hydrolase [Oleomonas cavernae]
MDVLRTPEDRFADLPGYAFPPRYVENLPGFAGLRLHYLDEGPREAAQTFLCLHGQPSWSYLYRRMIPVFTAAGGRVIAPDLFGFGRSDKPADDATYTYHFHRDSLIRLIEHLDLTNVTLVCQDWGGLYGLTIVPDMPARFSRLIVMNTAIPVGESPGPGFDAWKAFNRTQPDMAVGRLIARGTPHLTPAETAAYDAPYPDARYKGGVRRFPELVPVSPEMDGTDEGIRARAFWSNAWQGQSFMAIGMADPVLGPPAMRFLHRLIRNCPPPLEIEGGGHFVQEWGEPIATAALAAFGGR